MRKRTLYPLLVAGIMGMGGLIGAPSAFAATPFVPCVVGPGVTQTATTVTGTAGDDTIDCTNASLGKTIYGGAGNDTISGSAGDDKLYGNGGADTISGGAGNDILSGPGNDGAVDTLNGGTGTNKCGPVGVPPDIHTNC